MNALKVLRIACSILFDCVKNLALVIGGFAGIFFAVISGFYLTGVIGESIIAGRLVVINEVDGKSANSIFGEQIFFWILLAFWVIVGISFLAWGVRKRMRAEGGSILMSGFIPPPEPIS
jgi:hypothetical protein